MVEVIKNEFLVRQLLQEMRNYQSIDGVYNDFVVISGETMAAIRAELQASE